MQSTKNILAFGALAAVIAGLAFGGVVSAQDTGQGGTDQSIANFGLIEGQVERCINGVETPAKNVFIGIDGGSTQLARSDDNGLFLLSLPPGQYTVIATAEDGAATRPYVPVEVGEALDIGILDIGGGLAGCGTAEALQPALPTFTPTAVPTVEPTATPPPTPAPTATPVPAPADGGDMGSPGSAGSGG